MTSRHPRRLLLAGVSATALLAVAPVRAGTPAQFSTQFYAALAGVQRSAGALAGARPPGFGPTQSAQSTANIANLTARLARASAAQSAAAAIAFSHPTRFVPDGLTAGGLQLIPKPTLAQQFGTNAPTQGSANGRTVVTVNQTAEQALLTWRTFNVGAHTTLTFNQPDQSAVVLNQVSDPSANPSVILGQIGANGRVYILNPNGILFGAGSQVNVGGLVASSGSLNASFGSAAQFLTGSGGGAFGLYGTIVGASANHVGTLEPTFVGATAAVTVEAGARIQTPAAPTPTVGGGLVLLHGGAVTNDGSIATPSGQTILAAGGTLFLRAGFNTTGNATSTVFGTEAAVGTGGTAANGGIVTATLGDVTMVGHAVTQSGVLLTTISVGQTEQGTIHLLTDRSDATSVVTLAPGSVTVIAPDAKAESAPDSTRTSQIAASLTDDAIRTGAGLNDLTVMGDRRDLSLVQITTGGAVDFGSGSLTMAQGGQINVDSQTRALVEHGASIDVSGVGTAVVPQSINIVSLRIETPNLSDNPVSRGAAGLGLGTVDIDTRNLISIATGAYAGIDYTGGGALLVPAALAQGNGHGVNEWLSVGGTVTLSSHVIATQTGSSINLAGGAITYAAGAVPQSYLIGADGRTYDVNTAPEAVRYVGIYNGFQDVHPRWSVTDVYNNPLINPATLNEPGYIVGRDGGALVIAALPTTRNVTTTDPAGVKTTTTVTVAPALLLDGSVNAGVILGSLQTAARTAGITDGYSQPQNAVPLAGSITIGGPISVLTSGAQAQTALTNDVVLGTGNTLADAFTLTARAPAANPVALNVAALTAGGLGGLTIETSGSIGVASDVSLSPGGSLFLVGSTIDVTGNIVARGGRVSLGATATPTASGTNLPFPGKRGATLVLGPAATIDLRGEFSNGRLDGLNSSGLAFLNGGTATLASSKITLSPGSLIDVSAGYGIRDTGRGAGGAGGSVSVLGNIVFATTLEAGTTVDLGGTIRGYGVTGGGTLTVQGDRVQIGHGATAAPPGTLVLDPSLFDTGFQSYVVNAGRTLSVADGTTVAPVVPTLIANGGTPLAPTGDDPLQALQLTLLPLYTQNTGSARLTQRPGASLALDASAGSITRTVASRPTIVPTGAVSIGDGARITVDPSQGIRVQSAGQLTLDGTLTAHSGTVSLLNTIVDAFSTDAAVSFYVPGVSIWLGATSRIDVSGTSASALDPAGRTYGLATAGGSVVIGAPGNSFGSTATPTTDAVVIARPGSVIDASGASVTVDPLAGTAVANVLSPVNPVLAGPSIEPTGGGVIQVSSADGIFLDGTLRAPSGGAGAPGGSLSVALGVNSINSPRKTPNVLNVVASATPRLAPAANIGQAINPVLIGTAQIGADQIAAGGFGTVALASENDLMFAGSVTLRVANSLTLQGSAIGDSRNDGIVAVSAPVVTLAGYFPISGQNSFASGIGKNSRATLTVSADLVRAADTLVLGFGQTNIDSTGDIRLGSGAFNTGGSIAFTAAQIFPETAAVFKVHAGLAPGTNARNIELASYVRQGTITIRGTGAVPPAPGSIDGSLSLIAATIDQGGVLRAPEGTLALGGTITITGNGNGTNYPTLVRFEPGSFTSVGLDGARVPFGGTPDGQTYNLPFATGSGKVTLAPQINVTGRLVDILPAATIDISGGGELLGAGFIDNGRGGSVNVLTTPVIAYNPTARTIATPSLAAAPVYAIVPGYVGAYAPDQTGDITGAAAVPAGEQITIASGVPGLPAGTYTVLPASYALLPGAFRVQLGATESHLLQPAIGQPNGSFTTTATLGTVNTGTTAALPISVLLSSGSVTRRLSSFDEETFSQFVLAQSALTGKSRVPDPAVNYNGISAIAADAGLLSLTFLSRPATTVPELVNQGTLDSTPGAGGYGGTVELIATATSGNLPIEITGADAVPTKGFVSLTAAAVDAFGAQGLSIQGDVVAIRTGASLAAGQIVLQVLPTTVKSGITIESGATLSTLGRGVSVYNDPFGQAFSSAASGDTAALQSIQINGTLLNAGVVTGGNVAVAAGAQLLTQGTLSAAASGALSVDPAAVFGARYIALTANDINLGTAATIAAATAAGTVPTGLVLSQRLLTTLLAGDPALGTPALQSLTLVANSRVNLFGSVSLSTLGANSGAELQTLELSTPAIYGAGAAGDVATIGTGTLYLSGLLTPTAVSGSSLTVDTGVLPGAPIAGGPGFGLGTLNIQATDIVLGTGPGTVPNSANPADRLIEGFATVNLIATDRITSNNDGALSVYAQPGAIFGAPGTGGTLNLTTPLLTAGPATRVAFDAGGAINLSSGGGTSATGPTGYGGQITMAADTVTLDGPVVLPGGRFTVTAAHDIALGDSGTIDVAAPNVAFFDQVRGVPGGTVSLESTAGNVTATAASSVAIGSAGSDAGTLKVTALAGTVDLAGAISGAGGGLNGFAGQGGTADVRAATLTDVNGLNARLNAGGVGGARTLEIGSGDVTLSGPVTAGTIDISADAGSLTVNGTLDASGRGPGSIALAAHDALTIAPGSLLDVHETALRTDSYGNVITAENTAHVSLTSVAGTVAIAGGVTIDAASPDGIARGVLTLNAPRVGTNDIAVAVPQPVTLTGVAEADIVGWRSYTAGTQIGAAVADTTGTFAVAQADFDAIDKTDTQPFMAALLASAASGGAIANHTAGLAGTTVNLRPGVEVTTTGTLVIGDTDLHTYRYGGQPGVLRLRAAGDLVFNGSLTDGFGTVPQGTKGNPDDQGWIVFNNSTEPYSQTIVVPEAFAGQLGLDAGTTIANTLPGGLNYAIPVADAQTLNANVVIPQAVTLDDIGTPYTFTTQYTATADITNRNGAVVFARGSLIPAGTTLRPGYKLAAGSVLPFQVAIGATVWGAGESLAVFAGTILLDVNAATANDASFTGATILPGGALLPAGSSFVFDASSTASTVNFLDGSTAVDLRAPDKAGQGLIYATAPLLSGPSWSYDLVSGANLASAGGTGVQAASALNGGGNTVLADTHYTTPYLGLTGTADNAGNSTGGATPSFSVIRTGTGGITLASGGSFAQDSLFGVYTAGAATVVPAAYQPVRATDTRGDGTVLGRSTGAPNRADYNQFITASAFNYPDGGGDLTLRAQGDITGATFSVVRVGNNVPSPGGVIGNWLLQTGVQGVGGVTDQITAWGINFGTYVDTATNAEGAVPFLIGFTGIGTLGGGNLSVTAGGGAGDVASTGFVPGVTVPTASPIVLAVASTGRVTSVTTDGATVLGGSLAETGGGNLSLTVAGSIIDGLVTDLRGNVSVSAAAIGQVGVTHPGNDTRPQDPFAVPASVGADPLIVTPGDGAVRLSTSGDLNVEFDDPGRLPTVLLNGLLDSATPGIVSPAIATTNMSLWTAATTVTEVAAGGNLTTGSTGGGAQNPDIAGSVGGDQVVPPSLDAAAASGSIFGASFELAPSAHGNLDLLAQGTIEGSAANISGAGYGPNDIANPFKPQFGANIPGNIRLPGLRVSSLTGGSAPNGLGASPTALFAFEADTASASGHAADGVPQHVYAVTGDILDVSLGDIFNLGTAAITPNALYIGSTPALVRAGQDIVNFGSLSSAVTFNNVSITASGDLILNRAASDVSVLSAGRDIVQGSVTIAGPGVLSVEAGRNLDQMSTGQLQSAGPVYSIDPLNRDTGASIAVTVGAGAAGPDYAALERAYLNPDAIALPGVNLGTGPNTDRVAADYLGQLVTFLRTTYGYGGGTDGARAFFDTLGAEQKDVFLRQVYFDELVASGREETDTTGVRFGSYARGKQAISILFPAGQSYGGDYTAFSAVSAPTNGSAPALQDAGISTSFGGSVQLLVPGGQVILGEGTSAPGPGTGLLTRGSGDIDAYSSGSILLDLSRVFTTFGGNVALWSSQGDISAGNGAQSTLIFSPPSINYDPFAGISIAPSVPSSGAGIATLAPIPGVPAGNVDLIAPSGTIDAGEAGIRVSGNLNLAALVVANASNIAVSGKTTGAPTVAVANVGALAAAASAAGAATNEAQQAAQRQSAAKPQSSGSIITVEVVSNGG